MSGPGFSHELRQRQTQSLVLAPQLRQSLKILQVAALDLRSVIQEELQVNPTLEELPMDGETLEKPAEAAPIESDDGNASSPDSEQDHDHREEMDFTKQFEILGKIDDDWRDHMASVGGTGTAVRPSAVITRCSRPMSCAVGSRFDSGGRRRTACPAAAVTPNVRFDLPPEISSSRQSRQPSSPSCSAR